MSLSLKSNLINSPFDDPGLYVHFPLINRAFLFDLGSINSLSTKEIVRIKKIFISHTHIDHFCGFDHFLRIMLGHDKRVHVFGPAGILKNIEGKLSGYTWNLVEKYKKGLILIVSEVSSSFIKTKKYLSRERFVSPDSFTKIPFKGVLVNESGIEVKTVILDHGIPCLAFSIKERDSVNIDKSALMELEIMQGPWINDFKQALYTDKTQESVFTFSIKKHFNYVQYKFVLKELAQKIVRITPGQKISYVTDVLYSKLNKKKIIELCMNSSHVFIEACFLEKDRKLAFCKKHLTAYQAGKLAGLSNAKKITVFHFSPRYINSSGSLVNEALSSYQAVIKR